MVRGYDEVVEDPDETYASTPSFLTVKTLLTLAVARGWHLAFLHALMEGDGWVLPPVEYYPEGGVIWELKRALYGLKNALKLWQQHLAATLESHGFRHMKSDPNLYYSASRKVYILCYVDDLMIFGDKKAVADVVESLQKELLLRVTGELSEGQDAAFLGRRMRRTSTSVEMFMQTSYIDRILEQAGVKTCRAAPTPGTDASKRARPNLPRHFRRRSASSIANLLASCCGCVTCE